LPAKRFLSGINIWKSLSHILVTGYVMEMVLTGGSSGPLGSEETLGSVKACQGSREDDVMFKGIINFDREYFLLYIANYNLLNIDTVSSKVDGSPGSGMWVYGLDWTGPG